MPSARGRGSVYQPKYTDRHGVTKKTKTWHIKYYVNGQPVRESAETTNRNEALRKLNSKLNEVMTGGHISASAANLKVSALLDLVRADYKRHKRRDTYIVGLRIEQHLQPAIGHFKAREFGTEQVNAYIDARQAAGAANATINRELAILRRGFNLAAEMDPPKVAGVPSIVSLEENNERHGFVEMEQYEDVLAELKRARLALVIAYHLGLRKGELLKLEWSMVDLEAAEIRIPVPNAKNKKPRTLPIYGEMARELQIERDRRDAEAPGCRWVIRDGKERIKSFKGEWAAAVEHAGMPDLLFHDMRRSAVRNMRRAGVSEKIAMGISGHVTTSVFKRYDITDGADIKDAGAKLAAYVQPTRRPRKRAAGEG